MKITIVMPTYNDADSIQESLDSIRKQTHHDWQLIIMNDGSNDNTEQVVLNYISLTHENRIEYYSQNNQDQLHAIYNCLPHIKGDYVYILHSDDKLATKTSLADFIDFQEHYPDYDAYYGDQFVIDSHGKIVDHSKILKYKRRLERVALLYLWLGRNLYIDFAYFRKDVFLTKVSNSYLKNNMPYWLDINSEYKCLNVKKFNMPMFQYRIYEGNYINSNIGKLNVINGELRTLTNLMKFFYIPCYRFQYFLYRCFNKLKIGKIFRPLYFTKEERNKEKIIKFVIKKRFGNSYSNNIFLDSLIKFYSVSDGNRMLKIESLPKDVPIYNGWDMRVFNTKLVNGQIHSFYQEFLREMKIGFSDIICDSADADKINSICDFLCIKPFIHILAK